MSSITWMGATYSSVSQVTLPKTGGGVATFTEGGGGGGSEFVITYAWDDNDEIYEPDCTFAEVQSAYNDGKTLVGIGQGLAITLFYNDNGEWSDLYTIIVYNNDDEGCLYCDENSWSNYSGYNLENRYPLLIPNFDSPSKTYTPTESVQTDTITYDPNDGYNGISDVAVTINAIPTSYVGSGVTRRDSDDITIDVGDGFVECAAGYYPTATGKTLPNGTVNNPTATKGSVSNHAIAVTPSVSFSAGVIGSGSKSGSAVTVSASELVSGTLTISSSGTKDVTNYASASVASGSATPASTISGTGATVSHSGTTLTLSKTVSNTPSVSAGYVSSGSAGNSNVSLSATDANFVASNIKNGVSLFGLTGSYSGGGGGVTGVAKGTLTVPSNVNTSTNTKITDTATIGFTPKAFLFYRSDRSATSNHINQASFVTLGSSYYVRSRTRYSSNALTTNGDANNWTSQNSGYLYFNSNNVYFRSSSSYILAAGTWNWVAIQ